MTDTSRVYMKDTVKHGKKTQFASFDTNLDAGVHSCARRRRLSRVVFEPAISFGSLRGHSTGHGGGIALPPPPSCNRLARSSPIAVVPRLFNNARGSCESAQTIPNEEKEEKEHPQYYIYNIMQSAAHFELLAVLVLASWPFVCVTNLGPSVPRSLSPLLRISRPQRARRCRRLDLHG